jgi:hypothetical protein
VPNVSSAELSLARCPGAPGGVEAIVAAFSLGDGKGQVVHTETKRCLHGGVQPPVLGACDAEAPAQQWVLGASGRLCGTGGCLSVRPSGAL